MSAFKDNVDSAAVRRLADILATTGTLSDPEGFLADAGGGLDGCELKDRVAGMAGALERHVVGPFAEAADRIEDAVVGTELGMWELWPVTEWVARAGRAPDDRRRALQLLAALTPQMSGEFGIRPFIDDAPDDVLDTLLVWAGSPDEHVRRLASEGSRPRLPWAARVRVHDTDPAWALPVLELLKDDPSPYVRRSVANHLNDLTRLDRDRAMAIAQRWWADGEPETRDLVGHALRSLIKAGDPDALALLGFTHGAEVVVDDVSVTPTVVPWGGSYRLESTLRSTGDATQRLAVDVILHFVGARGTHNRKVFKWTTCELAPDATKRLAKSLSFRPITTRTYTPGEHHVDVQVNGVVLGRATFTLAPPEA